jgi:Carbamoyl-phosphate synthase L chain, ATP binding domain
VHVLFLAPSFPVNQREFVRGLAAVGAQVTGIGEAPPEALDDELRGWLHGYEHIDSVTHEGSLENAVRRVQGRGWVDRLEATIEAHVLPAARVRERCEIPGTSVRTAFLCRDKPAMKEVLREAGVACAASTGAASADDARAFAAQVGYPLILKPRDAAGAAGTYRVDDGEQLEQAIVSCSLDRGAPTAIEQFVEGHEAFYDTLCVGGRVVHEFVSHYYPGVLEAMRTRWISPQIVTSNRLETEPEYGEVRALGRRVNEVLGIDTTPTHMEWFFGPKGLRFSEIGCRPPGVRVWDLYGAANDLDLYLEWARLVVHGDSPARASRARSAGMIALRPSADGQIRSYEGLELLDELSEYVIDTHLPPVGSSTQGVEAGYMANAWVRLAHPDYDALRGMLDRVGEGVKVIAD